MSLESARAFYKKALVDDALRTTFYGVKSEQFPDLVKKAGYDFTLREINQVMAEQLRIR